MTFNDIFKSSFLENIGSVSLVDMVLALVLAFGLGLFIFLVYKKTFSGVMYSSSFAVTLVALTMITTLVILAVTSNVVLSLGIVLAAGMIPLAVLGSVFIGVVLLVFVNQKPYRDPYIVVLSCDGHESAQRSLDYLEAQVQRCVVKSKTAQRGSVELNLEVRMKDADTGFVDALAGLEGVQSAVLVSYNGDYMG